MVRCSSSSEVSGVIALRLEVPIDRSDASRRGIDPALCRLIVRFKDEDFPAVGRILTSLCPIDKSIYMTSVGEFVSLRDLLSKTTNAIDAVSITDQLVRLRCTETVDIFLSLWKAEPLVVFFANDDTARILLSAVAQSESKWWEPSKTGCESSFLAQRSLTDSVLFFSEDHMSLEAFGSQSSILKFFDHIRVYELNQSL